MEIEIRDTSELVPYANNARMHSAEQVDTIAASINEFGFNDPVGVWTNERGELEIVEGHGRVMAAELLGIEQLPVIHLDHLTDEQRRAYSIVHNQTTDNSQFDFATLDEELANLDFEWEQFGIEVANFESVAGGDDIANYGALSDRFVVPPFSVLDARQGYWRERKRVWNSQIMDNGDSRGTDKATISYYDGYNSTSVLDPVLAEIAVRWFSPEGGKCFDVFSGDTAFGYVCASLGRVFTGIELRQEQVDFNTERTRGMNARYICDDGRNVLAHVAEASQDMFFSCPPYYDLEVYSDLPNDASNQGTYGEFLELVGVAFGNAAKCLKDNRFAFIVVGDIRDERGAYRGFIDDIKAIFKQSGLVLYNDMIIVDPVGSARLKAARYMRNRKACKVHQNVLVFYKGDPERISEEFPEIEIELDETLGGFHVGEDA